MNSQQHQTYYDLLGVFPSASEIDIRRAYRELSKKYHPDTTTLNTTTATAKFQALNEAYATISHPDRRSAYDLKIGYSRLFVVQTPSSFNRPPVADTSPLPNRPRYRSYIGPTERPLSGGEIFALFMLISTFLGCLLLAVLLGIARGEIS
ncbi:J domain-containing protein [Chamaesiphon sp. VAR_69_metabat_338]|uniref:J domain-containing protein n=1 Tax=Chamaesiphon sp. VAR_69_metabat_338 TaxID=2964704 RepID=UPI00286D7449|nr:J domain-containing protein [Chamaesiphon sp. VAR_69_metabat_338]